MKHSNQNNTVILGAFIFVNILLFATDCFCQWVQVTSGMGNRTVRSLEVYGGSILAGTDSGIYVTTNNGSNWSRTFTSSTVIYAFAVNGDTIFAGNSFDAYRSTNGGINWAPTGLGRIVISFAILNNKLFAGTSGNGMYVTSNNGATWSPTGLAGSTLISLAVSGNNIFAGSGGLHGVYLTTNSGSNWYKTSLNNRSVYSLAANGNDVYAGTSSDGLYRTTNNGLTWSQLYVGGFTVAIKVTGNVIYAGTHQYGVYMSTNSGANWAFWNDGFPLNTYVYCFCITDNYIYAGTSVNTTGSGVYKRPVIPFTGLQQVSNKVPDRFSLLQNYPNPFNPSTKIRFALPPSPQGDGLVYDSPSRQTRRGVRIIIYDILGREVSTLVDEQLQPGTYEVEWPAPSEDAANFPSGVYFYSLISGNYTYSKKMILLR